MTHRTHIALRLGDNLAHLHFLRQLAKAHPDRRFIHYAHLAYLPQLIEVVSDVPNIQLADLETVADGTGDHWTMKPHQLLHSVDAWKNADGRWERASYRNDYAKFMFWHYTSLAERMGIKFVPSSDLNFDYPALRAYKYPAFDCLIVNSPPQSGQVPQYNPEQMEGLVQELAHKFKCVTTHPTRFCPCTQDRMMTVTQIGAMARFCRVIVMVSTGPSWTTFNVYNRETIQHRVVILGEEVVEIAPNTAHARTVGEARAVLRVRGVL
jgi:hypothetical protein